MMKRVNFNSLMIILIKKTGVAWLSSAHILRSWLTPLMSATLDFSFFY